MAIYLVEADRVEEMRATTRVMAAIEAFVGWMLWGPRQHDVDLRWSLGVVPRESLSEGSRESAVSA